MIKQKVNCLCWKGNENSEEDKKMCMSHNMYLKNVYNEDIPIVVELIVID